MRFELVYKNPFNDLFGTYIARVDDQEIARLEAMSGDARPLIHGAARAKLDNLPAGFVVDSIRPFAWRGAKTFRIALVNPKTSEHQAIRIDLTADQVAEAIEAEDPVSAIINFARPSIPRGFMPIMGGIALVERKPQLSVVN
jgi:hypothetical protein